MSARRPPDVLERRSEPGGRAAEWAARRDPFTITEKPTEGVARREATTVRTPQEVFQHHAEVLIGGDLEGIVSDYSDDAVMITPAGVKRAKEGIRETFRELLADLPSADWDVPTQSLEGDPVVHRVERGFRADARGGRD